MNQRTLVGTVAAVALGVVLGAGVRGLWPPTIVHATATHGQDNFVVCTAPIDSDVEALFVLDTASGDIKASVLNIQTRKFNSRYESNVYQDMASGVVVKNPQFRMVSGVTNFRQNAGAGQLGSAAVYVAELNSGQVIAYGIPWMSGRSSGVVPTGAALVPLDRWQFRAAKPN